MAWMFLTMALASGAGDHLRDEMDARLAGALTGGLALASIGIILNLDFYIFLAAE